MLTIKDSNHILWSKNIRGFHSSRTSTGLSMNHVDAGRINQGGISLINRLMRRSWLSRQWEEHQRRSREKRNEN